MSKLSNTLRDLPKSQQRVVFGMGIVATMMGFLSALNEWTDALRPGFIGAGIGSLIKDYINYLLGNKKEKEDADTTSDNQ